MVQNRIYVVAVQWYCALAFMIQPFSVVFWQETVVFQQVSVEKPLDWHQNHLALSIRYSQLRSYQNG
jgi:hypothetical protein